MKQTKLQRFILALDTKDLRRLREFIYSPYFNKNENIRRLFDFICDQLSAANSYPDPELIFTTLFPDEAFRLSVITKLSSKLLKLIEQYIQLEHENETAFQKQLFMLRFFGKNGWRKEFEQCLRQLQKKLDDKKPKDAIYFYSHFLLQQEVSRSMALFDRGVGDVNFQSTIDALDRYYLLQKLIYLCQQLNRQSIHKSESYDYALLEEIIKYLPQSPHYSVVIIRVWFTILLLHRSTRKEKATYYFQLRQLVLDNHEKIDQDNLRNIFVSLKNAAIDVFHQNLEGYHQELFDLDQFLLKQYTVHPNRFFTPATFLNVVTIALILKKDDWVQEFLEQHPDYSKDKEDNVVDLCHAQLCFARRNFSSALDHLNICHLKNIYFKLSERRLRLKVYYEMSLFDLFDDAVNSFRKFLSKNKTKISDLHLSANRDFINLSNNIFYTHAGEPGKLIELRQQIQSGKILPEKVWLLEKLQAMEK